MNANDTLQYVPTSISAFGLYCNEDLLKKHKQKIPKNLQEFMDVCAYFKNKGITPSWRTMIFLKDHHSGKGTVSRVSATG